MSEELNRQEELMYQKAVEYVVRTSRTTTLSLQRELKIGYNYANKLLAKMEAEGVVSEPNREDGIRDIYKASQKIITNGPEITNILTADEFLNTGSEG